MGFYKKVLDLCAKIPLGRVSTYGALARALGSPRSFRAVGNALNKNKNLVRIPCHRVIRSDGSVGGYVRGVKAKTALLKKEGVEVKNKKIDLNKYLFRF